jgi:serine/threonine protein kinase
MELAPNTRFGPYEIVEQIGAGGMGVVYKAMDTRLQRSVALKFLRPHLVPNADAKRRFMREAQAASALEHNNICTIYEVDETPDGQMYLAMRFYEGETLADRIARGAMPAGEAIAIASQVASGLARAHAAGIVHRDIKPANLLLCTDGTVKILDFGLTKHVNETRYTQHGAVLGTVAYMSPEQARGDAVDARSDVWALGVILYEMLTGQLPFRGGNDAAVLNAIASADAGHPSAENVAVPPALDAIVTKALAKDPSKRYPTASELLKELERLAAPAPQSVAQLKPWKRGVFGLAAALIVGAVAVWFWNYRDEQLQGQVERLILAIESAIDEDANLEAFELAEQLEAMDPDNPLLPNYWPRFSVTVAITSEPPGAEVSYRPYEKTDAAWITLGPTGLSARLPRDDLRIRFEKDGYVAEERAVWLAVLNTGRFDSMDVALAEVGTEPDGMIRIPAGRYGAQLIGIDVDSYELDEFFIDRYEVSNEDYFEFMGTRSTGPS